MNRTTEPDMAKARELKPCPFCGGEGVKCFHFDNPVRTRHWVLCRLCHASPGDRITETEAIAAWNRRALTPSPAPGEVVEAVERAAAALYADWVAEDFGNEYVPWDRLPDKDTWRRRARAALSGRREG